jgi:Arc/MetJ-type ribon-helix-helix transcriptional regulator
MVTTAFVIRQDQRDWLKQFGNRSEVVRAALDTKMKTTRKRKERS